MAEIVGHPPGLSQIVNESTIVEGYAVHVNGKEHERDEAGLTRSLKEIA
jgi:hypothetical protein